MKKMNDIGLEIVEESRDMKHGRDRVPRVGSRGPRRYWQKDSDALPIAAGSRKIDKP
jgi:hypothetical protein